MTNAVELHRKSESIYLGRIQVLLPVLNASQNSIIGESIKSSLNNIIENIDDPKHQMILDYFYCLGLLSFCGGVENRGWALRRSKTGLFEFFSDDLNDSQSHLAQFIANQETPSKLLDMYSRQALTWNLFDGAGIKPDLLEEDELTLLRDLKWVNSQFKLTKRGQSVLSSLPSLAATRGGYGEVLDNFSSWLKGEKEVAFNLEGWAEYSDQLSHDHLNSIFDNIHEVKVPELRDNLSTLLILGCGKGSYLEHLASELSLDIVGAEIGNNLQDSYKESGLSVLPCDYRDVDQVMNQLREKDINPKNCLIVADSIPGISSRGASTNFSNWMEKHSEFWGFLCTDHLRPEFRKIQSGKNTSNLAERAFLREITGEGLFSDSELCEFVTKAGFHQQQIKFLKDGSEKFATRWWSLFQK